MENTNNKSIVSLTLGVLSIVVPYIGFILGIIGLVMSKKSIKEIDISNEKGKGLATSGKVCSIVGICVQGILIFLMILSIVAFYSLTNVPH
ncbi:DUF4190 domain-containing protein [Viridibacillus sp. YIM B01967]|uniref:DUF4190 domain-containing protein n=1 Tax=Viridibacillus soli TaxID=2798301 RepID=A0ABS1HE71_9BACL|nr:DUF4190 domain-containing protein [Viridibacillus soli]MBK3497397.1 DUF4190 domain-containing protein [Viridibacillus soli]